MSLTSFPARIENVWQVIECMLNQTLKPKAIVLWLSKEQFPDESSIPDSLKCLEGGIFSIKMVDGDLRSHKKYHYVCQEFPDSDVLLIDDDLYYPTNMIENMMKERQASGNIVGMYASHILYGDDGSVAPYSTWKEEFKKSSSNTLFFGTGGGFLFKPTELYEDVTNIELAMNLCPSADDIWLNAMVRLNNKEVTKLKSGLILPVKELDNSERLCAINVTGNANDIQLKAINDYYSKQLGRKVFYNKSLSKRNS